MEVSFSDLETSGLIVDTIYKAGPGSLDEPIHFLFPKCGNMGGFRKVRRNDGSGKLAYVILYTTMSELEWPDFLDVKTGVFRYYGDNRKPGSELIDTHAKGNALLEEVFGRLGCVEDRKDIPPFFIFKRLCHNTRLIFHLSQTIAKQPLQTNHRKTIAQGILKAYRKRPRHDRPCFSVLVFRFGYSVVLLVFT